MNAEIQNVFILYVLKLKLELTLLAISNRNSFINMKHTQIEHHASLIYKYVCVFHNFLGTIFVITSIKHRKTLVQGLATSNENSP